MRMDSSERSGPCKSYFIAAYTAGTDDRFAGHAKVCAEEPDSVWNANSVRKLTSATGCKGEMEAVIAADRKARRALG